MARWRSSVSCLCVGRSGNSAPDALRFVEIAQLLWAAQGVTHPMGLRTVPSAGALCPLEIYVLAGEVTSLPTGAYHYQPVPHELTKSGDGDRRADLAIAALGQDWIADAPALLVLAAVHRRMAGKYGAGAERYAHIEVGHAAQNVYLQAHAAKRSSGVQREKNGD